MVITKVPVPKNGDDIVPPQSILNQPEIGPGNSRFQDNHETHYVLWAPKVEHH